MGTGALQGHSADFLGHIIKALVFYGFSETPQEPAFVFLPRSFMSSLFVVRAGYSVHRIGRLRANVNSLTQLHTGKPQTCQLITQSDSHVFSLSSSSSPYVSCAWVPCLTFSFENAIGSWNLLLPALKHCGFPLLPWDSLECFGDIVADTVVLVTG